MNRNSIEGAFKAPPFDAAKAEDVVKKLMAAGIDFEVEWLRNNKPVQSKETANAVTLKIDDTPLLSYRGGAGTFNTESLGAQKTELFVHILKEAGLVLDPNQTSAFLLAIGFCVLHSIIFYSNLMTYQKDFFKHEEVLVLHATGVVCALAGMFISIARRQPAKGGIGRVALWLFAVPGFILTVPSALMLLPAYLYGGRKHAFDTLNQHQTTEPEKTATPA